MAVNPYTENRKRANKKWDAENIWRFTVHVPKHYKELVQSRCAETGESMNHMFRRILESELNLTEQSQS